MRRFVAGGAWLLLCGGAMAQGSSAASQFVASRQGEVERMAEVFYNTRMDRGSWTQQELPECGEFSHHAFVRFDGAVGKGVPASFLAIYDLTHPPARSRDQPWQGGITLVRVPVHQAARQDAGPSPEYLITALNRALKQERAAASGQHPAAGPSVLATARCLVSLSDNALEITAPENPQDPTQGATDLPITTVLLPLLGRPDTARTDSISFDQNGLIVSAEVSVTPR